MSQSTAERDREEIVQEAYGGPANTFFGFQVANPMNRFAIGDRDALKFNTDGSLDICIRHENPGGGKESNWLPAPKSGKLGLTLRLYEPKSRVVNGLVQTVLYREWSMGT